MPAEWIKNDQPVMQLSLSNFDGIFYQIDCGSTYYERLAQSTFSAAVRALSI